MIMLTRGRMASKCARETLSQSLDSVVTKFLSSHQRSGVSSSQLLSCAVSANTLVSIFFLFRASKRDDPLWNDVPAIDLL